LKKFRKVHKLFIVEGLKSITEFFNEDYKLQHIFYLPDMFSKVDNFLQNKKIKRNEVSVSELKKISSLSTHQGVLVIFEITEVKKLDANELKDQFTLALDFIQDPGNL